MNKQPGGKLPARSRKMEPRPRHNHGGSDRMLQDTSAVSIVVVAVMIFGLLITIAAYLNVYYIPSWAEDAEAKHARNAFTDFSAIPGAINGLVLANETDAISKQRIELGGSDIPVLSPVRSWGSLGVVPQEGNFTVKADAWVVNIEGNVTSGELQKWGRATTANISDISLFYVDIYTKSSKFLSNGKLIINFTNRPGRVEIESGKGTIGKCYLQLSTWGGDGNKIVDKLCVHKDSAPSNKGPEYYRIDLLNPCYGFSKVLRDADTPYNLTVIADHLGLVDEAEGPMLLNYTIAYNEYNKSLVHYSATSNGTLIYESMNRYFLNQKFIYQSGAVFLCQPPDASMRTLPTIAIENTTNGSARITIPMVTVGTGVHRTPMISGSGVEELQLKLERLSRVSFAEGNNTHNVHIIIEPPEGDENFRKDYLQEWANYFNKIAGGTSVEANPEWPPDDSYANIKITLNGSIYLDIQDIYIEGRTSRISS